MAHGLGLERPHRYNPKALPGIVEPVFLQGHDRKIAPHRMVWPNYWGWMIGAFVWCMTPWLTSVPEALVDPLSNPDGDTLFTLSEAAGAYMGGGLVLIVIVSACSSTIKICWWLAKR